MILADANQKQIIAILTNNDSEFKAELVEHQTGDPQKRSTNDLSFFQANEIIMQLGGTPIRNRWTYFDVYNKQHSKVRSLCIELGWKYWSEKSEKFYADMNALGGWLQGKSPYKKTLGDMTPFELSRTIGVLEKMVKADVNKTLNKNL